MDVQTRLQQLYEDNSHWKDHWTEEEFLDLIQLQLEQERKQINIGLKALRDNTQKAENKAYASSSVYGVASIQTLLPAVEEAIKEKHLRIHRGHSGKHFAEIKQYLIGLEPLVAAGITTKVIFDKVFSHKSDEDGVLTKVYESVGTAVMAECQMRHYETVAPGLLRTIKENYWHSAIGTQQKLTDVRLMMNRAGIEWKNWSAATRVRLGNVLVDCVLSSCNWFYVFKQRIGRKTTLYLMPTAEFLDIKDQILQQAELYSAEPWPMLIPPSDWKEDGSGGYLLNEVMRAHKMVRKVDPTPVQGKTPVQFLNKIQKVAYTLNPFIVEVAEALYESGTPVGKFLPHTATEDLPPKPVDIDTNADARKDYCRRTAEVYNRNHALIRRSCRTRMTMKAVERYKNVDRWFHIWSFDYRGRIYPVATVLSPQDTDFGKSLLRFADEQFLLPEHEDWLRFQVATTYGLDKKPMAERIQWAHDHVELIHRVATDSIGYLSEWEAADEPWQFLAACEEYNALLIDCTRHSTGLPVAVDATCSGLQILAGLARDASTARLVNVLPSEQPQDAYKAVAEYARPQCPEHLQSLVDRTVAKRLVMTIPYNAKFKSNWGYVKDALVEKGVPAKTKEERAEITAVTHALRNAVWDRETETGIFPGPIKVMDWIEEKVREALADGRDKISWVTPSGFHVEQKLMKPEIQRMELQLLGKVKKVSVSTKESNEVHKQRHLSATSPNLIHSLDAAVLCLSAIRFDYPLALIHDSVLCRATDMHYLSKLVRETYMYLFAEHNYLEEWSKQVGVEFDPSIIVGDLEPESVIESTYFFC